MGKNLTESYCYRMDLYRIRAPTLVIPLSCLCHFQNLTNVIRRSWKLWESMAYQRECLKAESLVFFFPCHFKVFLTSNSAIIIAKFWVTGVKYLISHLQSFQSPGNSKVDINTLSLDSLHSFLIPFFNWILTDDFKIYSFLLYVVLFVVISVPICFSFMQNWVFSCTNYWLAIGVNGICLFSCQSSKYEQTIWRGEIVLASSLINLIL